MGKPEEALLRYKDLVKMAPLFPDCLSNRASCYMDLHSPDRAISDLREVLKLNRRSYEARHGLGEVMFAKHEYSKAIAESNRAIKINPSEAAGYITVAKSLLSLGKVELGLTYFRKAAEKAPSTAWVQRALLSTLIELNKKSEAVEIARALADTLDYVGTLCVEFFLTRDEKLLVNEIAPRPHNSGHLTFGPCITSQFEQQLRAVCGLPLGSTEFYKPAAMANLLGDIWQNGELDWPSAIAEPNVKLHLYGKAEPRPGRKMGHLTGVGETAAEAARAVRTARHALTPIYDSAKME